MARKLVAGLVVFGVALSAVVDPALALTLLPAFALLALHAAGVHPGERLIERLRRHAPARGRRAVSLPRPRLALVVRPAGHLLASALAMRPPPCLLGN
jgi:hypothetical protein